MRVEKVSYKGIGHTKSWQVYFAKLTAWGYQFEVTKYQRSKVVRVGRMKGMHYKWDWHEHKTVYINDSKLYCIRIALVGRNIVMSVVAECDGNLGCMGCPRYVLHHWYKQDSRDIGFGGEVDENCVRLGYCGAGSANLLSTFRENVSVPSSSVKNSWPLRNKAEEINSQIRYSIVFVDDERKFSSGNNFSMIQRMLFGVILTVHRR